MTAIVYNAGMPACLPSDLKQKLQKALDVRFASLSTDAQGALRLFNGFYEGFPDLVVDLYGSTLLLFDYRADSQGLADLLEPVEAFYLAQLPWLTAVIRKLRAASDPAARRGWLSYGEQPARQILEHGVCYALDLCMHQDASFYLDTRHLRRWLLEQAAGWTVFNSFAYTGSLGIAALAGGARQVIQGDHNRKFLDIARQSAMLNRFDLSRMKSNAQDFFSQVASLKRTGELFDCVILDPPFFSSTQKGTVDQVGESMRLVNKVRPLVKNGGWLVTINNALFLSGAAFYASLQALCQDGYLALDTLLPVPEDICGYPETVVGQPPAAPAPFNHATKIAVLSVRRK